MRVLPDWLKLVKGSFDDDGDEPVEMLLSANIGYDPETGEGINAQDFINALGWVSKRKEVLLNINSLGGRIDQGTAMCSAITLRGNVTTCVIGYAASMGAMIHQAGAKRLMMPGTMIMIHNPMGTVQDGDHREMESAMNRLAMIKSGMVDMLADRTKLGKRKISELMDATTFMDAKLATELNFVDEVVDGSPVMNAISPDFLAKTCRQLSSGLKSGVVGGDGNKPKAPKTMKLITAALAKARLLPSSDLTDEAAIVSNFENSFGALGIDGLKNENKELKLKVEGFEQAQETRVTNAITKAISDKLVKADRKDALIAKFKSDESGLTEYLNDLNVAKGSAPVVPQRRGAPPVNTGEQNAGSETESKIETLRAEMVEKGTTPARVGEIAKELRTLRGHGEMFASK